MRLRSEPQLLNPFKKTKVNKGREASVVRATEYSIAAARHRDVAGHCQRHAVDLHRITTALKFSPTQLSTFIAHTNKQPNAQSAMSEFDSQLSGEVAQK